MLGTNCFLHREALAAKDMVPALHETLKDVIKVVYYIKWSPKNNGCFRKLCEDMGSEHAQVLYHAVRWLSRRKVLSCVYELKQRSQLSFQTDLVMRCGLHKWLISLMCLPLQRRGTQYCKEIEAFKKEIALWAGHVTRHVCQHLPWDATTGQKCSDKSYDGTSSSTAGLI